MGRSSVVRRSTRAGRGGRGSDAKFRMGRVGLVDFRALPRGHGLLMAELERRSSYRYHWK